MNYRGKLINEPAQFELDFMCETTRPAPCEDIIVECSSEQIELIVPKCLYEQEDIQPNSTIVGKKHFELKTVYSPDYYKYEVVLDNADQYETFHFDIDLGKEAYIGFSDKPTHSEVKLEILIGAWDGWRSAICSPPGVPYGGHVAVDHDRSELVAFRHNVQVTLADGIVQVFNETLQHQLVMEWQSSTIVKSELTNLLVSGGYGGYGMWKINAERKPKSKEELSACQGTVDGYIFVYYVKLVTVLLFQ